MAIGKAKTKSKDAPKINANKTSVKGKASAKGKARRPGESTAKQATSKTAAKPNKPAGRITFPDVGLHLAVLGALLENGMIEEDAIVDTLEGIDPDAPELERLKAAMAKLHGTALSPKNVARIERLDFDGGNEIYMLMEQGAAVYTGGEDDTYCLRSLAGIDALTGLQRLNLDGHGYRDDALDLGPLANHPTLTSFRLSGTCSNASALESIKTLRELDVSLGSVDDPQVLDRLAARGVEVTGPSA